ncbi:MAG: UDP-3-O-acyl-N-acetylglucosamine deacetylase [Nitrospiraceae bacterium]|nr:MAG: UDP-3-O-acyl-N-acetylglucosamine deacetylase [Nitrospiraceae bacterium]
MRFQNTIKQEICVNGTGLHTGRVIHMRLKPAPRDTGIVFIRSDRNNLQIKAGIEYVADTTFATNLRSNGSRIGTVEHLLAALAGLKVDNLYVELDGPEVPVMDGSSYYFTQKILRESGVARQAKRISCVRILKPIVVTEGVRQIGVFPYEGMRITCRVNYNHPSFKEQKLSIDVTETNFIKEIAPARTFGFLKDVRMLRANGLAKGGSLDNAIVVGDNGVLNKGELRFENEFVRHKILDIMGDFSLLRKSIYGHIVANKPGHTLNIKLLKKILSFQDAWEIMSVPVTTEPHRELTLQI